MSHELESKRATYAHTQDVNDVPSPNAVQRDAVAADQSPNQPILERYINLASVINFDVILLCSWEAFALTFQFALLNGGPSSMVYGCILVGFGATAVAASLAELASMDPSVGAQYRWSANFAPFAPKFWGLIQGWITIFAWMIAAAGPPAIIANIITALAVFNYDTYTPKGWHTMLIMWALIIVPFIFNLWFRKLLNALETLGGLCHVCFYVISIITLAVLARKSTNEIVWQTLTHGQSGWENLGVTWGLGLLTITFSINGFDGVLHMSDEVVKVRTRVPKSIMIACISNSIMLFAYVICLLYTLGDINLVTNTPTGLPLIEVYYQATNSKGATVVLVLMPAFMILLALFNAFASCSRLVWQFAKDDGLPFSKTFAYVHPTLKLPLNSLALVAAVSFILSLIYVGSTTAFNAIISLQAMALSLSYVVPITFLTLCKFRGREIPYGPYKLGRFGVAINLFALAYLVFVILWMPFPQILPVTGSNMNYAGPLLGAVILGALVDWMIGGRKRFKVTKNFVERG